MRAFYRLGAACSHHPVWVTLAAVVSSAVLCLGLLNMRVQTDPHGIWVPPDSVAASEQARFNELFHPFFRINQLIFYIDDAVSDQAAPADTCDAANDLVQKKFLLKMAQVQTEIASKVVPSAADPNVSLSLEDFCYRPIKGKGCLVTSPLQYWRGNASLLQHDPDIKLTTACQTTDATLKQFSPCMDQNGVPVMRNVVFGGLTRDSCHENPDPCGEATPQAKALMVTFMLHNNPENATYTADVEQWEKQAFIETAQRARLSLASANASIDDPLAPFDGMKLTFMAERSIADSLEVQTKQNAFIVVVSYLVMFVYVSMSLGKFTDPVHSRYGLGLTGIIIVLLSLGIAMGVSASLLQMEVTMITLEVVPFLILAIGVDNMFILTNEFDRLKVLRGVSTATSATRERATDDMMLAQVLGETMFNVGPSIVVAAVAETLAFLVGALTKIPALTSFCVVAAIAVVADFVLQMTWFSAALILDAKRVRARRYDLFPLIKQTVVFRRRSSKSVLEGSADTPEPTAFAGRGIIKTFVEKTYTPALLRRSTKFVVLTVALSLIGLSCLGFSQLQLGLEQELAVPTDFYLHKYFQMQTKYGEAGPLAYLVLEDGMDYTDAKVQGDVNALVDEMSNLNQYVQLPVSSWLQTFNQWRQLRFFLKEKIDQKLCDCPPQPMDPFPYELVNASSPVFDEENFYLPSTATGTNVTPNALFYPLVRNFTQIPIDSACCQHFGLCGAQYEGDIVFKTGHNELEGSTTGIAASRLRFQVNAMTNQSMFVNSYFYLHELSHQWNAGRGTAPGDVFPYTLYFVYYEQYTYIQGIALQSIALALAVVLVSVFVLMEQNLRLSLLVTVCVLSMTVTQVGFVFVCNALSSVGTSINAVSVVNLLATVGLGVEFCIHTTHQFAFSQANRLGITGNDHTKYALATVGSSIISGITLTKFCGIGVLAFAPSLLFRVYFFRMYMGIVVLGFFHGLVLLPVLLSLFGQKAEYPDDFSSFLLSEERDDEFEDERGAY